MIKRKICIIDDERQIRKNLKDFLKKEGFLVKQVPNALEVANMLMRDSSTIDLVVLDINMPEIDGRGIWEIIEEYGTNFEIIVSSVLPVSEQKFRIPKAAAYHNKLDGDEALLKKIKKVLGV